MPRVRFVNRMELALLFQFTGPVASKALCLAKMNYSTERVASALYLYYFQNSAIAFRLVNLQSMLGSTFYQDSCRQRQKNMFEKGGMLG